MKIWTDKNFPIIISCAKQLSRWTEAEVLDMGYKPIEVTENTVVVRGDMRDMMRLNLFLRTGYAFMLFTSTFSVSMFFIFLTQTA